MAIISNYHAPAVVMSIIALSVTPLIVLFFRIYYRGLEFLQMAYLFAFVMAQQAFSNKLTTAMVQFDRSFFNSCTTGDFVCTNGFALSFGAVLAAILGLTFLFVSIQKCCNKTVEYEPVYSTFKGFIKWIYVPLAFSSTFYVLTYINQSTIQMSDILLPAIVLGILVLLPFFQLIGYKCIQTQKDYIWRKWMQFLGYIRLLSTSALIACHSYYNDENKVYLQCVMISLIIYFLLYLWKGEYKYPILERVVFLLGEGVFLTLYYLFKYKPEYITDYDLDLFGLAGVIGLDFLLYLVRGGKLFFYGVNEGVAPVNPENQPISPKMEVKKVKVNKYQHDSGEELQNSRDSIQNLQSGRYPPPRRRR